jgi:hypothetical protein
MIFGKKGSGKTTLLTKLSIQHRLKGWNVYSNVHVPFAYKIDDGDVGFKQIPPESVLLIDEVGMIWDNRDFKSFKKEVRDWFKLQRHYRVKVYLFSQAFDIDKKLRDLTDDMYLVEIKMRIFSYARRILKRPTLKEAMGDSESRLVEELKFQSFFLFWCGSRRFTFIPKYAKYFDSFEVPPLPEKEYEYIDANFEKLKRKFERATKKRERKHRKRR